ncbi:GAF domain-containing protein [Desulfobulbus alkaliphilus]|nr:GAF domain-containing sensor histidine kinase [Desulfobulbus alkaliphilus]MBM9535769.1 GAF domain-containing protein [Desulfobulbus alkaliphilus]
MVFDPQEIMDTIVRSLPQLLGIDACTIRLLDTSTRSFVLGAAHGVSIEYLSREIIDTEATMARVRSGCPVSDSHVDENPFYPFREAAVREGIKGVLTLPIVFQGELIGIMRLLTRKPRNFSSSEISSSMVLAEQVGVVISHGRMFREMANQLNFLREIQEISRLVNSTLDLDAVLRSIVERVAVAMNTKACTLRLLDPDKKRLELVAASGVSDRYLQRGMVEKEQNIRMVLSGEPVAIYDVSSDRRVEYRQQMLDEGIVSLLAVPVQVNEEVIGVMRILADAPRVFTDTEVRFAVTLAEVGGSAIRNARSYQQINGLVERIEAHEQFLADIINSLQHQLLVLDRQRRVVLANQVFLDATGKKEAEILGMEYGELCTCTADAACCPVDQILQGKTMQPFIQKSPGSEGTRWLERTASPIFDADGHIDYVVEIIRDITSERMLAEEKMERGKLQGVVELAGTVAHEINTPLFAALGTAELLAEDRTQPEEAGELEIIIRNLRQIGELTRKMTSMTGFTGKEYVGTSRILTFTDTKDLNP